MSEKTKKPLSSKYICFLGGVALCLFSVILIMNIGTIARVFSFVSFFLFGIGQYFIYFYLYFLGFYLIIKDKGFKYKHKIKGFAWVLFFIGLIIFISALIANINGYNFIFIGSSDPDNLVYNFSDYFIGKLNDLNPVGGYLNSDFIYMFDPSNSYAGGYLGLLLTSIINQYLGESFTFIISISLMLIALAILIVPIIIKLSKKGNDKRKDISVKVNNDVNIFNTEVEPEPIREFIPIEIDESMVEPEPARNVARHITNIKPVTVEVKNTPREEIPPMEEPTPVIEGTLYNDPVYENTGVFSRPKFHFFNSVIEPVKEEEVTPVVTPVTTTPVNSYNPQPEYVEVEPVEEIDTFEPYEEEYVEEETIEEEVIVEETVDTSLATVQPTYQEPIVKERETPTVNTVFTPTSVTPTTEVTPKRKLEFIPPSVDLLDVYETSKSNEDNVIVADQRQIVINESFANYRVGAHCESYIIGPSVTRFNIVCDPNVSVKQVASKIEDLCIRLGGVGARFEAIVAGKTYSGLEVPNAYTTTVSFKEVYEALPDVNKNPLSVPFGKDISGNVIYANFNEFPHMLVAGTTGSGKSVYVHSIILSLIMRNSPDDLKLILVDPKQVEMNMYFDMPHLLCPVVYEALEAKNILSKICEEMDNRYSMFKTSGVNSIKDYNRWAKNNNKDTFPYIIIVIDEYADLVEQCKDVSTPVVRLAAKARAAGIHMLIATQRPSVNVITGVIKSNLPTHVALMTSNAVDSMTILNEGGAEKLLGKGDMLVQTPLVSRVGCTRVQSPFVTSDEIDRVVNYLKTNYPTEYDQTYLDILEAAKQALNPQAANAKNFGVPEDLEGLDRDEILYRDIRDWAMTLDYCSMSKIQREFSTGFNRAGRIFKRLQEEGIVADQPDSPSSSKGCRVLVHDKFYKETSADNPALDD